MGLKVRFASAGNICTPAGGAPRRPNPSSVRHGFSALLIPSPAMPRDSSTRRCSMSTNSPERARLLQFVLAVVSEYAAVERMPCDDVVKERLALEILANMTR